MENNTMTTWYLNPTRLTLGNHNKKPPKEEQLEEEDQHAQQLPLRSPN